VAIFGVRFKQPSDISKKSGSRRRQWQDVSPVQPHGINISPKGTGFDEKPDQPNTQSWMKARRLVTVSRATPLTVDRL
jgi:hypothetical protein